MDTLDRGGFASRHRRGLLAALVFAAGAACVGFDNGDVWFMDVHAKDMLENGFYGSVGRFTAHEGIQVPHQKWAMCLLVHLFARLGDWTGIGPYEAMMAGSALFCGLFALCLYFRCLSPGREARSAAVSVVFTFLLSVSGMSVLLSFRPHVLAACLCMLECMLLERRFSDGPGRTTFLAFLAGMAGCSFVAMWFHSTMWPLCLVPVLPYLGEAALLLARGGEGRGRTVKECLAALGAMVLAGCLNPLGLGQFEYMRVTALAGSSWKYSFIGEMRPFWTAKFDFYVICWMLAVIASFFALALDRRNTRIREWLFFFGSTAMSAVSVRLMIYFYALVLPVLCAHLDAFRLPEKLARRAPAAVLGFTVLCTLSFLPLRPWFREVNPDGWDAACRAAEALKQDIGPDARFFAIRTETASMLLWHGLRPAFDTRGEIYDGELNGGPDVLADVNYIYEKMVADEEVPWDDLRRDVFDKYGLDAMVFPADYLPGGLMDGVTTDTDIRTFTVGGQLVVCERLSSLKQQ